MSPYFFVRVAGVPDAPALSRFAARTFREAFVANASPDAMTAYLAESFNEARVADELADARAVFLVAQTASGDWTGYTKLFFGDPLPEVVGAKPVKLWRLYTASEYQRQGVGTLLLEHAVRIARDHHDETLWLTVNNGNTGAVRFYKRHGFIVTGTTTFNLGGDLQHDFVMERRVRD